MTNFNVDYKVQFHQSLWDHYVEGPTTYTSSVDVFGDIKTTASNNISVLGSELHTHYIVEGTLSFTTDKPIKYIYLTLLLCNRVGNVIDTLKYSYMGPFNGSGSFDLHKLFGKQCGNPYTYVKVNSVVCDYMDGTSGEAEFDLCEAVEVLEIETQKDRNAKEEPSLKHILKINLLYSPLTGVPYSIYKLIKGYKKAGKYYLKISLILFVIEIVIPLLILLLVLMATKVLT